MIDEVAPLLFDFPGILTRQPLSDKVGTRSLRDGAFGDFRVVVDFHGLDAGDRFQLLLNLRRTRLASRHAGHDDLDHRRIS